MLEEEDEGRLAFLDVLVNNCTGPIYTQVYHGSTSKGLYTSYYCFTPHTYKVGFIKCLFKWAFKINSTCKDFTMIHSTY